MQIKQFAGQLISANFQVDLSHVQFGCVVFNEQISALIPFNMYETVPQLVAGIQAIPYNPGLTNTALAFVKAAQMFNDSSFGSRPNARKAIIYFSDGR